MVVIIGGGYDLDYEKLDKDRNTATAVKGNALYVMDAENGNLLLAVGANTAATTGAPNRLINSNMKYSVAGRVKTLDRDADGLADHIYFNDLGGQVFRVDLQNALGAATSEFGHRVTRLANLTAAHGAGSPGPRFYEAPAVTIHDEENQRFAVVSVASGDRSSPLDVDVQNRVYAIVDRDVTKASLYTSNYTADSTNITLTGLTDAAASGHASTSILSADGDWKSAGWYRVLDEYTNKAGTTKTNQKGLKAFNELAAIRNDLYVSVYNPHETADSNPCSAQVLGASELHRYCLPFGVCAKLPSNRQRYLLGQGIQAVNFGPGNDDQSRRIIYPTPNPEKKEQGEGTLEYKAPPSLMPIRWYEKQPKLPAAKE
ncbi:MAG: hypothetical protein VXW65_13210 [Pseudomonadota bacterium]|nr:hypothetical protein [Pseudomonadota bacterium]